LQKSTFADQAGVAIRHNHAKTEKFFKEVILLNFPQV
jgi:hypothetical protein